MRRAVQRVQHTWLLAVASVMLVPAAAQAQAQAQRVLPLQALGTPIWRTAEHFTDVSSVVVFGDGSMLVADPGAIELLHVSKTGTIATVSRTGSGPGEYRQPQTVHRLAGTGVVLVDPRQFRLTIYDSVGKYQRAIPFPSGGSTAQGIQQIDAQSQAYFPSFSMSTTSRDIGLLRWNINRTAIDTVAHLLGPKLLMVPVTAKDGSGRVMQMIMRNVPYSAVAGFAVTRDGRVAIARAKEGVVEWYTAQGARSSTVSFPAPLRVPLSDSLRRSVAAGALRDALEPDQAPFAADQMIMSDKGLLWVRRTTAAAGQNEWLAFSEKAIVGRVTLPPRSFVVAATADALYVARRGADELEAIEVYALRGRVR